MVVGINSTALNVSFSPPSRPNGMIVRYEISYVPTSDSSSGNTDIVQSSEEEVIIGGLEPFTEYNVSVVAVTSAGAGESMETIGRTVSAASSPPTNFVATITASDYVTFMWGYPEVPRGIIQGYIILYYPTGSQGSPSEQNITLPMDDDDGAQMSNITGLTPFTSYTFRIRAYSFEENPFRIFQGMDSDPLEIETLESGTHSVLPRFKVTYTN